MKQNSIRVLLVSGDEANSVLVRKTLDQIDGGRYLLERAEDWPAARERLLRAAQDVCLVDCSLHDEEHHRALRDTANLRVSAPLVILCRQCDKQQVQAAWGSAAVDCLLLDELTPALLDRSLRYALERRRAERALHRSEQRFDLLMRNVTGCAICMLDLLGRITDWNEGAVRITGYPAEEAVGKAFALLDPDSERAPEDALRQAVEQGQLVGEGWRTRRDGSRFWADTVLAPLYDAEGDLSGYAKLIRDVSARRQEEEALRESEARFRTIIESSPVTVFLLDDEGEVIYVNRVRPSSLDWGAEDPRAVRWLDAIHPEDRAGVDARWEAAFRRREPFESVHRLRDPAGRQATLAVKAVPVRDGEKLLGYVGTAEDITERLRLEEQLRQSQKMEAVGLLAGGIAHDFNNMLGVVTGYCELLLGRLPEGSKEYEYVGEIAQAGERAAALTRQLLVFSRSRPQSRQTVDLNEVVEGSLRLLRPLIGEDIEIATLLGAARPWICADPSEMDQLLMNLVVNARDAMPRGGMLTIETRDHAEQAEVELSVRDTGNGIAPEVLSRMWEPFFTTKDAGKGTGLGLSTVYQIVQRGGGTVQAQSTPGDGTTFRVRLPRVESPAEPAAPAAEALGASRARTLLVVEDEPLVRAMVCRVLRQLGHRVLEADGAAEALRLCREERGEIHLLLTDVVMPQRSGPELAAEARGLRPEMRVLFMSGYPDEAMQAAGAALREVEFIQKPFRPAALAEKVAQVLEGKPAASP